MSKTKRSYQRKIVLKDGSYQVEETEIERNYDLIERKWISNKKEPTYKPLSDWKPPISKEITLNFLERREAISTHTLEPISGFFLRTITVKIPKLKSHENIYLGKIDEKPLIHDLSIGFTRQLTVRDIFNPNSDLTINISKAKRISKKRASKLVENKEVYPHLIEQRSGGFVVKV